jgi:hypothetical protein
MRQSRHPRNGRCEIVPDLPASHRYRCSAAQTEGVAKRLARPLRLRDTVRWSGDRQMRALGIRPITALLVSLIMTPARSETVDVKYRGTVDLAPFACTDTPRSSFIQRVCYDKAQSYMLINLRGIYYHYCEMPTATFEAFLTAPSMGQFYNQKIKGSGSDGPYDCRTHRIPSY